MSDSDDDGPNDIGLGILFGNIGEDNKVEADYLGEVGNDGVQAQGTGCSRAAWDRPNGLIGSLA